MERLGVTDGPDFHVWGGWLEEEAPQPDSPLILDWVRRCDPRPIVVVDSFAAFHGGDENDAGETRRFMHRCRRLANLGAIVVVIHHDGKADSAKDYRGSSDFKAAVDVAFQVSNFGDTGHLGRLVLRTFKSRFGFAGELTYEYTGGRFIRGDAHDVRQTINEQLTGILRLNPGVTSRRFEELVSGMSLGRNQGRRFLADGMLSGSIRREHGNGNTKLHFLEEPKVPSAD
jgi:hypothetical protein